MAQTRNVQYGIDVGLPSQIRLYMHKMAGEMLKGGCCIITELCSIKLIPEIGQKRKRTRFF